MKKSQSLLRTILLLTFFSFYQPVFSQYSISGYLKTDKPHNTIYLAVLSFEEQSYQSQNQILTSIKTDSTGYFEIKGQLLSEQDKLYRIYANISDTSLDLINTTDRKNYHNFIFSNQDTIFFPKDNSTIWFNKSKNTNLSDKEWKRMKAFESRFRKEFKKTQNPEAIIQVKKAFTHKYKAFCNDSITSPLVNLLAYTNLKIELDRLDTDFNKDPEFYYNILLRLKKEYGETSYYSQFQKEIIQLSHTQIEEKYSFHKYLNYVLAIIIVILILFILKVLKSKNSLLDKQVEEVSLTLTLQEKKIADLIIQGQANKEIASTLFISLSTVKTHITSIYSKLKVTNRRQIIKKLKNHTRD